MRESPPPAFLTLAQQSTLPRMPHHRDQPVAALRRQSLLDPNILQIVPGATVVEDKQV